MKKSIHCRLLFPIVCFLLLVCLCKPERMEAAENKSINEIKEKCFINLQILNRLVPQIDLFPVTEDSTDEIYTLFNKWFSGEELDVQPDGTVYVNDDLLVINKRIDDCNLFAITYCESDSLLVFYRMHKNKWKEVGRRIPQIPIGRIYFEELNAEPGLEVVISTNPNMNGNSWKECFVYFPDEDTIKYAGNFSTDYEADLKNRTITEVYEGSWYMDPHKTVYGWYNHILVPLRMVTIIVIQNESDIAYIEYYENLSFRKLELIFREQYDPENPVHKKYWEGFE